ncbi:uncharacterized protein G2W53_001756 [Senna tora]|uniref:Uncharacterized protein n=1 Tax=Senna tora TaxID=362788 RepID=A0A834XJ90_9FABA|nr:uncharacterized protein G2W53_001756 [Senna tora]
MEDFDSTCVDFEEYERMESIVNPNA